MKLAELAKAYENGKIEKKLFWSIMREKFLAIEEYAEFALEQLNNTPHLKNKYDGYAEPQKWRAQTKFERKGMAADRKITELFFEKEV